MDKVTLCPSCFCLTHTINGRCGKCGKEKAEAKVNRIKSLEAQVREARDAFTKIQSICFTRKNVKVAYTTSSMGGDCAVFNDIATQALLKLNEEEGK